MFGASFIPRAACLAAVMSIGGALAGCNADSGSAPSAELGGAKLMSAANPSHTTNTFAGVKVNGGTATHRREAGRSILILSDDFKVPDAPAPHWQVVDSRGNTYLLNRLVIKGDKFHKQITVPAYVTDIAKVQIWCAYAEVLLGEATFAAPVH